MRRGTGGGWRRLAAGACVLALTGAARAQTAVELASLERRASDRALSVREREQASDRAVEVRRKLIGTATGEEPELLGWLVDQGAALLALPAREGADSAALLGIALPGQAAAVRGAAEEAAACLRRAGALASAAHTRLEAAGVPPEDARMERLDQERLVRVPFYLGRAEALLAALEEGAGREGHAGAAIAALEKLALANRAPECVRRVTHGAALLRRGAPGDAQAALEELAYVATVADADGEPVPASARAEAWMGLVHASAAMGNGEPALARLRGALARPPFTTGGRVDPLWTVLASDAGAAAAVSQAVAASRAELLGQAVEIEMALLARSDLGFGPEALRPLVFEKLAILAGRAEDLPLPAGMRLARAVIAARDPGRHAEAVKGFADVAAMEGAGPAAADALWEWAVLLTLPGKATDESRHEAARVLTRLAREHPASPRAAEAIGAALAYARALENGGLGSARAREAYLAALALATASYQTLSDIDVWRYERARVLAGAEGATLAELTTALDELRRVPPDSRLAEESRRLYERAQGVQFDLLWETFRRARLEDARLARAAARDMIEPAGAKAVEWARSRRSGMLDRFRLEHADALTEAGSAEGRAIYKDLLARGAAVPGGAARVKLGLARSMLVAGESAAAFPTLHEAAGALDAPPAEAGMPARPEEFWHAWSLMLELLEQQNKQGTRSGTILAHVRRLEVIDPALGGEPWRTRIDAVRARVEK